MKREDAAADTAAEVLLLRIRIAMRCEYFGGERET
jgi:hypothetical protein